MPGYTKADFYAAYGFYAVDPVTGIRYAKARAPEFLQAFDAPDVTEAAQAVVHIGVHALEVGHSPVQLQGALVGDVKSIPVAYEANITAVDQAAGTVTLDLDTELLQEIAWVRLLAPSLTGYNLFEGITLRLHYHPFLYRKVAEQKAQQLIDAGLVGADDRLIIAGGAFGWLGEALEVLMPGCQAVAVDTSPYVQEAKDYSPDDELIESIQASGYDETQGVGLFLFNKFSDSTPRAAVPVLQEDLTTEESRNTVIAALGELPTRVITEECWQIFPQEVKDLYNTVAADLDIPTTHIIDGVIT